MAFFAPPVDEFSGKPFCVECEGGRFLIYSIGPNAVDEHGAYNPRMWSNGGPDDAGASAWDVSLRRLSLAEEERSCAMIDRSFVRDVERSDVCDKVGDRRLAAGSTDDPGDLSAVVSPVDHDVGQDVEYRVREFVALDVPIAKLGREVGIGQFFDIGFVAAGVLGGEGFAVGK